MLSRRSVVLGGLALSLERCRVLAQASLVQASPEQSIPDILKDRIDVGRETLGLVAAFLDGDRRSIFTHGRSGSENDRALDGDTVFEIGSITKVFTGLLFADMVLRGEVAPDDSAAKFLPAGVKMPDFEGAPITLLDLATYTSGLPRMPSNFAPRRSWRWSSVVRGPASAMWRRAGSSPPGSATVWKDGGITGCMSSMLESSLFRACCPTVPIA